MTLHLLIQPVIYTNRPDWSYQASAQGAKKMPLELALELEQEQREEQGWIAEESREDEPMPERDPDDFLEF